MLVDSHCHLDRLHASRTLDAALQRAEKAGVSLFLTVSVSPQNSVEALRIARLRKDVYATFGLHPNCLDRHPIPSLAQFLSAAREEKVVALGESGLDYHYNRAPKDLQMENLHRHIEAARKSGLPLILHMRNCAEDLLEALASAVRRDGPFAAVLHSFSGGWTFAKAVLDMGMYISFSGMLTFKSARSLREVAGRVPRERLLIETDTPYLAPEPMRGTRNEPANVVYVAARLAEVLQIPVEQVAEVTTRNFLRLFDRVAGT